MSLAVAVAEQRARLLALRALLLSVGINPCTAAASCVLASSQPQSQTIPPAEPVCHSGSDATASAALNSHGPMVPSKFNTVRSCLPPVPVAPSLVLAPGPCLPASGRQMGPGGHGHGPRGPGLVTVPVTPSPLRPGPGRATRRLTEGRIFRPRARALGAPAAAPGGVRVTVAPGPPGPLRFGPGRGAP